MGGKDATFGVKDPKILVIMRIRHYKEIGLRGFEYILFEEKDGGKREGLDGFPYLKHLIKLWPGDWGNRWKNERSGNYEESCYIEWGRETAD